MQRTGIPAGHTKGAVNIYRLPGNILKCWKNLISFPFVNRYSAVCLQTHLFGAFERIWSRCFVYYPFFYCSFFLSYYFD